MNATDFGRMLATAALTTAVFAADASAASYSVNGYYPGPNGTVKTGTDWVDATQTVSVAKFDTTLGTLTSATLTLYGEIDSSGTITNDGAGPVKVTSYTASLLISILKPGSTGFAGNPGGIVDTLALTAAAPVFATIAKNTQVINGTPVNFSTTNTGATSATYNIPTIDFATYQTAGAGTVVFPLYTETTTLTNLTGGALTIHQTTSALALATITYTYDAPVGAPEPASLALLGVGMVGMAAIRRRRRKLGGA